MAPTGEVIELSVEETNTLRAKLGLAPLRTSNATAATVEAGRGDGDKSQPNGAAEEVLEMSVNDTNALRVKLGLVPLRSGSSSTVQHAPAVNVGEAKATADRVERARLQRQVQEGATNTFGKSSLGDEQTSALSFAENMRLQKKAAKKAAKKKKKETATEASTTGNAYGEADVQGITVGHTLGEFQEGSTTVLTLADTEILTADDASRKVTGLNEDEARLENANLTEAQQQEEGLRKKRQMEMGMGRAGGYAGFDDDEFEELGGTQGPSRTARGADAGAGGSSSAAQNKRKSRGFQIGTMLQEQEDETDLFATQSGKAVSLHSGQADVTMSDYMTKEEEEAMQPKKKKEKSKEFKNKKKKKGKKERTRKVDIDDEEEEEAPPVVAKSKSLADELEETASAPVVTRKRRRQAEDDDDDEANEDPIKKAMDTKSSETINKRSKYDAVMEKGNQRTKVAFTKPSRPLQTDADEEPDDAFLNAALAKARRLNRLKQMSEKTVRGADAVAQAMEQSTNTVQADAAPSSGIQFSLNGTREFTLALRAKKEQEERERAKKDAAAKKEAATKTVMIKEEESNPIKTDPDRPTPMTVEEDQEADEDVDVDMAELANQVKEDEPAATDLLNTGTATMGRGLGSVMQMLRQTGEISRKNAKKEEQRGRAKDERTYEDYQPLDLKQVVRIDERNATSQDRDLAHREIKLEYRDEHGRLLTRKEAFRDLSYQFHGFGSGKRKAEKKLKQIEREQAEQRVASRVGADDGGMLGALKKTQKSTGKAFVIHKT